MTIEVRSPHFFVQKAVYFRFFTASFQCCCTLSHHDVDVYDIYYYFGLVLVFTSFLTLVWGDNSILFALVFRRLGFIFFLSFLTIITSLLFLYLIFVASKTNFRIENLSGIKCTYFLRKQCVVSVPKVRLQKKQKQ